MQTSAVLGGLRVCLWHRGLRTKRFKFVASKFSGVQWYFLLVQNERLTVCDRASTLLHSLFCVERCETHRAGAARGIQICINRQPMSVLPSRLGGHSQAMPLAVDGL